MSDETPKTGEESEGKKKRPVRPEKVVTTSHRTTIAGQTLDYTATVGTLHLKNDRDEPRASVFFVAITLDGGDPRRPVTFCFNGGPGSSAVWLQLGCLGPRRVDMPDLTAPAPAPYRLVDNEHGILDLTDLVFIDPVGTGFSRPAGEAEPTDFQSIQEDVQSVGEFVQRWITRNHRWNSPKFLAGESYGTTRAAALAHHLQERGLMFNGLVLVSLALNFQTFVFEPGNDLPSALYLPSYAAAAWYHGRLADRPPALEPFLDEVRRFAIEEYAPALLKGSRIDPASRRAMAARLARYTGLHAEDIERRNNRIEYLWFAKQLLGDGRTVGRLDARFVGHDGAPNTPSLVRDPSLDWPLGAYAALVNDYLRRTLGWDGDESYEVLNLEVNRGWKWQQGKRMGFVNVTGELQQAMVANPHLKVLIANGYYDLATPFFAAEYTADHLDLDPSFRGNLVLTWYQAGHMMYLHPPSLAKLRADLVAFYALADPGRSIPEPR